MSQPNRDQKTFTRRRYLQWAAGSGLVITPGCSASQSGDSPTAESTESPTPSPTASPSPTATPTATASPTPSLKSELSEGVVYRETPQVDLALHGVIPEADEPVPTVIWAHGGAWWLRVPEQVDPHMEWLAERGYAGVSIEYRVTSEAGYPAPVRDVAAAVWWVRQQAAELGIDPEKLVLAGYSAGGHLATLVAVASDFERFRPREASPSADYSVAAFGSFATPYDLTDKEFRTDQNLQNFMNGSYEESPDAYQEASPISHVDASDSPSQLFHSASDQTVPFDQARAFEEEMNKAGTTSDLTGVSGGHGFFNEPDEFDFFLGEFRSFLDNVL